MESATQGGEHFVKAVFALEKAKQRITFWTLIIAAVLLRFPILSALLGGKAQVVFRIPEMVLATTEYTIREVIRHIPELAEKMQAKGAYGRYPAK